MRFARSAAVCSRRTARALPEGSFLCLRLNSCHTTWSRSVNSLHKDVQEFCASCSVAGILQLAFKGSMHPKLWVARSQKTCTGCHWAASSNHLHILRHTEDRMRAGVLTLMANCTRRLSKSWPPRCVSPAVALTSKMPSSIASRETSKVPPPRSKISTCMTRTDHTSCAKQPGGHAPFLPTVPGHGHQRPHRPRGWPIGVLN